MIFKGKNNIRKWIFRIVVISVSILLALVVFDVTMGTLHASRKSAYGDLDYYHNIISQEKVIALSFDDGPHPGKTTEIMDILEKHDVTATFFFVGSQVLKYPSIVKDVHDRGFEIGNHTYTHSPHIHDSENRLVLELNITNKLIESITGVTPVLYRPPFLLDVGSDPTTDLSTTKPDSPLQWAAENGYVVVGADVDSKDWQSESPEDVYDVFFENLDQTQGHITLLHDGGDVGPYTIDALDAIIIELKIRGYRFVPASYVLGLDAIDSMTVHSDIVLGDEEFVPGDISALQKFLLKEGYFNHYITGYFGWITQNALIAWQANHNVAERGFVGPETREAVGHSLESLRVNVPIERTPITAQLLHSQVENFYLLLSTYTFKGITTLITIVLTLAMLRLALSLALLMWVMWIHKRTPMPHSEPVSVIIPVYNEEENIGATLESVVNNGYRDLEIIVVDDGSKDNSAAIIESFQKNYPDIVRLVRIKNGGKANALNVGLMYASHEIVITMDGDTIFGARAIQKLVQHFSDPNVGAVAGKVCATNSRNLINRFQRMEYTIAQNIDKTAFASLNAIGVIPGPIGAWRKEVIIECGGYATNTLVEDQDMTLAFLASGRKIVYESESIAYTETPFTVRDFIKQRLRWVFGTIQCLWKYKSYFLSFRRPALGWVVLPNTMLFTVVLSVLYPFMDLLLVVSLASGFFAEIMKQYLIFTLVDLLYVFLAYHDERENKKDILLLPLQRLFYRFVIYYVVIRSLIRAVEGSEALWNKVKKRGDTSLHHVVLAQESEIIQESQVQ